jgi:predicted ATP-dependent endonuclease of OLD family
VREEQRVRDSGVVARTIVLVEGASDQHALDALAVRRGRDLGAEGVAIVAMGGASNFRRFLQRFGPRGANLRLAGLCDAGEARDFRRELERAGLGVDLGRPIGQREMEALGFFVCVADLEDELIRALGVDAVEQVIDAQGELGAFRTLQKQAAQQNRSQQAQLRRFMGTRGGRKIRYARLLVDELDPAAVPRPLDRLLAYL